MSQIGKALKMYLLLQAKGKMKVSEIASLMEIDERTVRRYRDDLECAGIYIDSERGKYGGYKLLNDKFLLGLNISLQEQYSLQLIEKYLKDSGHIASEDISNLVLKLSITNSVRKTEIGDFNSHMAKDTLSDIDGEFERKKLMDIHTAVLLRKKLNIVYTSLRSGERKRIVRPYATLQYKQDMYFIGYCELKKEIRDFKISRIKEYEVLDKSFPKDENFNIRKSMENCFGIYKGEEYNIKLKIMPPMSQIIKEKIWVKNQVITENSDNSIIYEAKMRGLTEIKSWILGMGSAVIVLEPQEIVNEIKEEISNMKKLYLCNDMPG
ncbi:MAG: helix-turn-helix transcriptional regulator [Bacillota bacterium]